jgi:FKBP-type peptidyl-prolyl cis-trans isomerase FkpA
MRKNLMFLALAAIGFAGCKGGFKQDPSGILYNVHNEKSKVKIKEGDFISLGLVAKNDADSVIFNSYDGGQPQFLVVQAPQFKGDLMDGLKLVGEGDSVTFKMVADSVFKGGQQRPPSFKSSKYVVYDVRVQKVIPKGKLTDEVFQRTISTYVREQMEGIKKQEPAKLNKYLADNKLNATKTASGLYYVITKQGTGPVIAPNDTAVVNYTGKLINGKVFDSNIREEAVKGKLPQIEMRQFAPIRFPVGQQQVIPGWDEGLQLLNKGAKATLIIPSTLGYGEQGSRDVIPPNSPLIFDVELVDIVHPSQAAKK